MRAAWVVIAAALVLGSCVRQQDWIDRTLVTENVTGVWDGSFGEGNAYREVRLDLKQEGSKVTGLATIALGSSPLGGSYRLQGSVAGDVITFNSSRGTMKGELTVSGDDMSGQIYWIFGTSRISLHRVDSLPRTESPPR